MIALTSGYHLAVTVVCPDQDHILRNLQAALTIQFQNLSVQICAEHCVRNLFSDHCILFLHNIADQFSPLLGSIKSGIIFPERYIALSPEAHIPDDFLVLLPFNSFLPKLIEQVSVFQIGGFQIRISPQEHFRSQRLRMVMCDHQPHIRRNRRIDSGIFICSGNHQITAAAKQRFKHHFPWIVF